MTLARSKVPEGSPRPVPATRADGPDPGGTSLVTADFHQLADFANFRADEAAMLREGAMDMALLAEALVDSITAHLSAQVDGLGGAGRVSRPALAQWFTRSSQGPFDGTFADSLRDLTHLDGRATFPGVSVALPPQMVVATMAWVQGEILLALGNVTDTITLSGLGGVWMDLLVLQLGIILEPVLRGPGDGARHPEPARGTAHPYCALAGFGPQEQRILDQTGGLLGSAAGGILPLARAYLGQRTESAQFVSRPVDRAGPKPGSGAWWAGERSVAGTDQLGPDLAQLACVAHNLPPQLTMALIGWLEMRILTALNTVPLERESAGGELGDPASLARVGRAWMSSLTLQLGTAIDPFIVA